ncbi:hypothetical protein [Aminobacter sp. MDW-2]|uniref:hypothetical protein n=1 Tax=Aminobacter sp. MDW-2 TaxID=2666139 RepID=UPI0012AFA46E|nr:hypothetical protein [Aminobacter sp. MDW-2]MRX32785.1 hypothetical protein [Aminobacter sp. MDW-2]QNH34553.1 hypothetical protein H5P29_00950 [Aminobacter sp. MDW-2]
MKAAGTPYHPTSADWREAFDMLCGHCAAQPRCEIVESMIELKSGGQWPGGGWVHNAGAGVTCLSYEARPATPMPRQQRRAMCRQKEAELPPVCDGCAARKGTDASVSLHTQRDYQAAVRNRSPFVCHQDPEGKRLCGGWCRAIRQREA